MVNSLSIRYISQTKLGVNECMALISSERIIMVGNVPSGGTGVTAEIWFSGLYRYDVRRDRNEIFLQFYVSRQMIQVSDFCAYAPHL